MFFSQVIQACKKNYVASKEMKLFLKLIERGSSGSHKSCICYMKTRKIILESLGKSNDNDARLEGLKVG